MRGNLIVMHHSIPFNVQNSLSTSISFMTSASQTDEPGSQKRALKVGQQATGLQGYTVGYNGEDLLTVDLCEHGKGLFTLTHISDGDLIIAARGQLQLRSVRQEAEERKYTWEPNPAGLHVFSQFDVQNSNIMRFVNSSRGYGDAPNAVLEWHFNMKVPFLRASGDITPDATGKKEILVDYEVGV